VETKETIGVQIARELRRELRKNTKGLLKEYEEEELSKKHDREELVRKWTETVGEVHPNLLESIPLFSVEVGCNGTLPTKGSGEAAGYDLYAAEEVYIRSGEVGVIPLDIKAAIPKGYYGRIADRSGLACDYGLTVLGGVIDSDYRGEWKVLLHNTENNFYCIKKGNRVAQVIITPCANFPVAEVSDLEATARGEGGFGSTGK